VRKDEGEGIKDKVIALGITTNDARIAELQPTAGAVPV
jgi:hypothetical protein